MGARDKRKKRKPKNQGEGWAKRRLERHAQLLGKDEQPQPPSKSQD